MNCYLIRWGFPDTEGRPPNPVSNEGRRKWGARRAMRFAARKGRQGWKVQEVRRVS